MADHVDLDEARVNPIASQERADNDDIPEPQLDGDDDNGSEWEYEYDPDETEDIYITLDLTSRVPEDHNFPRVAVDPITGELRNVKDDVLASEKTAAQGATDTNGNDITSAAPLTSTDNGTANTAPGSHRIKVADLHTANPIIVVDDKLYSCAWATAIGTDLYFAPSSPSLQPLTNNAVRGRVTAPSANEYTPTHPLIGMTSARLIAQPAKLVPKDIVSEAIDATKTREELDRKRLADQSHFLDAFQDLKRRMGEDDTVPRQGLPPLQDVQDHYDRVGMAISRGQPLTASEVQMPGNAQNQVLTTSASIPASAIPNLNRPHSLLDVESATLAIQPDPARLAKRRAGSPNEAEMSHQSRNARKKRKKSAKLVMYAEDETDGKGQEEGDAGGSTRDDEKTEQDQGQSKKKK